MLDESKVEVPDLGYTTEELTNDYVEDVLSDTISEEEMEEVALRALGRVPLQDLINDSVSALVEVYKARPESYAYDASHYDDDDVETPNPFMDLIKYLQDVKENESPRTTDI